MTLAVGVAAIVLAMQPLGGMVEGFSLVVRAADRRGAIRAVAELATAPIVETVRT